jgi:hypothetical protein
MWHLSTQLVNTALGSTESRVAGRKAISNTYLLFPDKQAISRVQWMTLAQDQPTRRQPALAGGLRSCDGELQPDSAKQWLRESVPEFRNRASRYGAK